MLQFARWEGTHGLPYPIFVPSAILSLEPLKSALHSAKASSRRVSNPKPQSHTNGIWQTVSAFPPSEL